MFNNLVSDIEIPLKGNIKHIEACLEKFKDKKRMEENITKL